jgi:hypothetical protein
MRTGLKNINGERKRFIATFQRFGTKPSYTGRPITTLLFVNVRDEKGTVYSDHLWFTDGLQFQRLKLEEGEHICFDARVKPYTKGYKGRREDVYAPVTKDYKLSHPNNIVKSTEGIKQGQLF